MANQLMRVTPDEKALLESIRYFTKAGRLEERFTQSLTILAGAEKDSPAGRFFTKMKIMKK